MFYSHEILTSTQYGVATIWLVATIGPRSNTRKITRKAIQGVNIPRACDTISQPGAPIALRLQGNLLYGVSRVYSQQCAYMLTDVEKVQSHMQAFFRVWGTSSIDPQAGKAKRDQLVIQDDPAFDLNFSLPAFNLDNGGSVLFAQMTNTQKTSSQMSPLTGDGSSGSHRSPFAAFDISASPAGSGLHQLEMPFGRESMVSQKPLGGDLGNLHRAEEDELVMDDDWGIRIDEDGNVVLADEPQLPRLPRGLQGEPAAPDAQQNVPAPGAPEPEGEIILDVGDDILPEAEAFPQRRSNEEVQNSSSSAAAAIRKQRRKPLIIADERTMLTRTELLTWSREYSDRSAAARKTNRPPTRAQARKTAYDLTFGFGIGRVGAPTGIPDLIHPLAELFAGPALERSILGFTLQRPAGSDEESDPPRGRRRTSAEAFGGDPVSPSRRVRPRLTDTPQAGRGAEEQHDGQVLPRDDDTGMFDPDDDNNLELGREAPASAQRSDISAPWNRPGSVPGSSARGSAAKVSGLGRRVSASPLHGRGSGLPAIERLSSDMNIPFGGSDPLGPQDDHSSVRADEPGATSRLAQAALDREGRRFLEYVGHRARTGGEVRHEGGGGDRSWIEFDSLFEPADATRAVVTQAFFHVLVLATRSAIKVEQDEGMTTQFGPIRVGVLVGEEGEEEGGEGVVGGI